MDLKRSDSYVHHRKTISTLLVNSYCFAAPHLRSTDAVLLNLVNVYTNISNNTSINLKN